MTRAAPLAAAPSGTGATAPPSKSESRLREYAAPIVLSIVMLGFGLFHLSHKGLWHDEGFTWSSATLSNGKFVDHLMSTEANGGIYLVFQHLWVQAGTGLWWLRFPSVVFAAATVPVMWALTRRLFDARAATLATALLVLNGTLLEHVQEARAYPLVVLLACTSMYWFVREMETPGRRTRRWWVVATICLVLSHAVAGLVFGAQIVSLLVARPDRDRRRHVLLGAAAVSVVAIPFVLIVRSQPEAGPVSHPSLRFFYNTIRGLSGGGNLMVGIEGLAACGALALLVVAYRAHERSDASWRIALPALWFGLCSGGFFLYSQLFPGFQQRYLLAFVPGLFILVAVGLLRIPNRVLRVVAIVVVLALATQGVLQWYQRDQIEGWREIAAVLQHDARPGDAIVFDVDFVRIPVSYYLRDQPRTEADLTPLWPGGPDWKHGFFTGDYHVAPVPPAVMAGIAASHDRIWVVDAGSQTEATGRALKVLERTHRRVRDIQVDGPPSLQLYERR